MSNNAGKPYDKMVNSLESIKDDYDKWYKDFSVEEQDMYLKKWELYREKITNNTFSVTDYAQKLTDADAEDLPGLTEFFMNKTSSDREFPPAPAENRKNYAMITYEDDSFCIAERDKNKNTKISSEEAQEYFENGYKDKKIPKIKALFKLAVVACDKGFDFNDKSDEYSQLLLGSLNEYINKYIKDKLVELKESVRKDKKICKLVKDDFEKITFNIDEAPVAALKKEENGSVSEENLPDDNENKTEGAVSINEPSVTVTSEFILSKIKELIDELEKIPVCDCVVCISRYRNILQNITKWLADPIGLNALNLILCTKYYNDFSGRAMINKIMILESAREECVHEELKFMMLNVLIPKKINLIYSKLTDGKDCGDAIIDNEGKTIFDKSVEIMNKAYIAFEEAPKLNSQLNMYALIWKKYGQSELENYISEETPNVIFYGSPGTGKTYLVKQSIAMMTHGDKSRVKDVQCHPGFGYEEFIEGLKPVGFTDNGIKLEIVNGAFKDLCIKAKQALLKSGISSDAQEYFFVADEINRANLSAMFGETLSLLEADYRDYSFDEVGEPQPKTISTPLSTLIEAYINESVIKDDAAYPDCKAKIDKIKELAYECELYDSSNTLTKPQSVYEIKEDSCVGNKFVFENGDNIDAANAKVRNVTFGVPRNIRFIGMMNDVDKSIDAFDLALRRRFKWKEKRCDYTALTEVLNNSGIVNIETYKKACLDLNNYISQKTGLGFGRAYEFGHAYFMKIKNYVRKNGSTTQNQITNENCEALFEEHLEPVLKEYIRSFEGEDDIDKAIDIAKNIFKNPFKDLKTVLVDDLKTKKGVTIDDDNKLLNDYCNIYNALNKYITGKNDAELGLTDKYKIEVDPFKKAVTDAVSNKKPWNNDRVEEIRQKLETQINKILVRKTNPYDASSKNNIKNKLKELFDNAKNA